MGPVSLLAVLLAACQGTEDDGTPPPPLPPEVSLGTGVEAYVPVEDGDPITIVFGPQGGYHLDGSMRAQGIVAGDADDLGDPTNPLTIFRVWDATGDPISGLEGAEEITRVAARARALGKQARISLRIKPGVEIDSHSHIATGHEAAKFGIARSDLPAALAAVDRERDALSLVGFSVHVGSMVTEPAPYVAAARVVADAAKARRAQGHALEFVDFGGGFGVDYGSKPCTPPPR